MPGRQRAEMLEGPPSLPNAPVASVQKRCGARSSAPNAPEPHLPGVAILARNESTICASGMFTRSSAQSVAEQVKCHAERAPDLRREKNLSGIAAKITQGGMLRC